MWETWVRSLCWEDPLEKGKATHSSILAWRIPWPVQSMGSQRVGHKWEPFTLTFKLLLHVAPSAWSLVSDPEAKFSSEITNPTPFTVSYHSCLENPIYREVLQDTVHRVAKRRTQLQHQNKHARMVVVLNFCHEACLTQDILGTWMQNSTSVSKMYLLKLGF